MEFAQLCTTSRVACVFYKSTCIATSVFAPAFFTTDATAVTLVVALVVALPAALGAATAYSFASIAVTVLVM